MAKIRNGFVSNSSSSSFIIGIGKVTNLDKLQNFMAEGNTEFEINTVKSIKDQEPSKYCIRGIGIYNGRIRIDCEYSGDQVSYPLDDLKDEDLIVSVDIHNNEGDDGEFGVRSQSSYEGEPFPSSYFDDNGQGDYLTLNEENHGVSNYTCAYGCKRNG